VVGLELWLLLGSTFDVGQAKRLFGLIGAGAVLGATLGAVAAKLVASLFGARELLLAAGGAFALGLLPTVLLERRAVSLSHPADTPVNSSAPTYSELLREPYLQRVGIFLALGTITLSLGDFIFKTTLAARVPASELGNAFATAYLVYNVLAVAVQLGFTGLVLRVVGLPRALVVLPVLMTISSLGVVATGAFAAAVLLRGADGVFRHSIYKTSTELLYLPLPDSHRKGAKPLLELLSQRGGQMLAAFLTLALVALGASAQLLGVAAFVFALAWLLAGYPLGRLYVDAFRKRLNAGDLVDAEGVPELDLRALEAILSAFNSARDEEVVGAMDLLVAQQRAQLIPALILYHPSAAVVLYGIETLVAAQRKDIVPIAKRLLSHSSPEVRAAAVRALGRLTSDGLASYLEDTRPEVRATALAAQLAVGGSPSQLEEFQAMLRTSNEAVQRPAILASLEDPAEEFVEPILVALKEARSTELRSELLRAVAAHARRLPSRRVPLVRELIEYVPHRDLGAVALAGLVQIGPSALEQLASALEERIANRDAPALVTAIAAFPTVDSVPILMRFLREAEDGRVRYRCLKLLQRARSEGRDVVVESEALNALAQRTLEGIYSYLALRVLFEAEQTAERVKGSPAGKLLIELLKDKVRHAQSRMFLSLGLLYRKEDFEQVERGLNSADAKLRASSRELLGNVVKGRLRDGLIVLVDEVPDAEKIDRYGGRLSSSYRDNLERLAQRSGNLGLLARAHLEELTAMPLTGMP
jgi:AAA family ATP:ADP antiporter